MSEITLHSVGRTFLGVEIARIAASRFWDSRHSESTTSFCKAYQRSSAVCIAFDLHALGVDDLRRTREVSCELWRAPLLVVDESATVARAVESFRIGATDYASNPFHWQEIQLQIDLLIQHAKPRFRRVNALAQRVATLSRREVEVLQLLLNAQKASAIAHQLTICEKTVENRRARIFDKLNVGNLAELFRLWIDSGASFPSAAELRSSIFLEALLPSTFVTSNQVESSET